MFCLRAAIRSRLHSGVFSLDEMDTNVYLRWCMIGGELDIPPKAIELI